MRIGICDMMHPMWPKFRWVKEACERLGHETVWLLRKTQLEKDGDSCDIVLFGQSMQVHPDELRELSKTKRCKWAAWVFDMIGHGLRNELRDVFPWDAFDFVFCKTLDDVQERVAKHGAGTQVRWLDQASPLWPVGEASNRSHDIAVIGTWTERRQHAVEQFRLDELDVLVAGVQWPDECQSIGAVVADAPSVFGATKWLWCDAEPNVPGYRSDRMWLGLAAGTPCLCEHVHGLILPEGAYRVEDATVAVTTARDTDWYLAHALALQGAEKNRYEHRVAVLLKEVGL